MNGFIFFLTLMISILANAVSLNDILALVHKKHSELGTQKLEKKSNLKKEKITIDQMLFNSKDIKYQLEISVPVSEVEFIQSRKIFSALTIKKYQEEPMPYQGEITKGAICPKKFIPTLNQQKVDDKDIFIVKYFTSENYNYRICEEKLAVYATCTSFYLDQKKLQQFKLTASVPSSTDCVTAVISFFSKLTTL